MNATRISNVMSHAQKTRLSCGYLMYYLLQDNMTILPQRGFAVKFSEQAIKMVTI